jgi:hypothetical protein
VVESLGRDLVIADADGDGRVDVLGANRTHFLAGQGVESSLGGTRFIWKAAEGSASCLVSAIEGRRVVGPA